MLCDVDQCNRKIAGGAQDRYSERANHDHVTSARLSLLPKENGPSEQTKREGYGDDGVAEAEPLEVKKAFATCAEFVLNGLIEPVVLAPDSAEGFDEPHIPDNVDHFAVHCRSLAGEIVMQRLSVRRDAKHDDDNDGCRQQQGAGHVQIDAREIDHRSN